MTPDGTRSIPSSKAAPKVVALEAYFDDPAIPHGLLYHVNDMALDRVGTAILSNFISPAVAVPKPNERCGDKARRTYSLRQFLQ